MIIVNLYRCTFQTNKFLRFVYCRRRDSHYECAVRSHMFTSMIGHNKIILKLIQCILGLIARYCNDCNQPHVLKCAVLEEICRQFVQAYNICLLNHFYSKHKQNLYLRELFIVKHRALPILLYHSLPSSMFSHPQFRLVIPINPYTTLYLESRMSFPPNSENSQFL